MLAFVILGGLLLASSALFVTVWYDDPLNPLFRHALTIQITLGLVVWCLFAWTARRLIVGKLPNNPLTSTAVLLWGGFRVALLVAMVMIIVTGLSSLALGLGTATAFVRAIVLILVVTVFTGAIGGAFFNSLLVIRRFRQRTTQ